ncbi:MAG: peroxidase-related enzyme [Pirellulaceae bacterium]|nr:peroxidase-related enzyme [Pirellulaceae bacterium]
MAWIETISPQNATGKLAELYEQIKTPDGHIDNVLTIHSLRPRTLAAHLALYKAAIHSRPNDLSPRERELVGTVVSALNGCHYCKEHHQAGLTRHLDNDSALADELVQAATGNVASESLTAREKALSLYATKLTRSPEEMVEEDILPLREHGLSEAGILDLNQIVAYFAYVNRMVLGLGVDIHGEPLGLHPSEDEEGFRHS